MSKNQKLCRGSVRLQPDGFGANRDTLEAAIESDLYRFEGHIVCSEMVRARALFHYLKHRVIRAFATRIGRRISAVAKTIIFTIDMYF